MARWQSFVKRHHAAIPLAVAAVLVMLPARHTGSTRFRLFSHDIDVPVTALLIAMLVIGFAIGCLLAKRRRGSDE
jgi:hypothetical protein